MSQVHEFGINIVEAHEPGRFLSDTVLWDFDRDVLDYSSLRL